MSVDMHKLPKAGHVAAIALLAGTIALPLQASADEAAALPPPGLTFSGVLAGSLQNAKTTEGNLQLDMLLGLPVGPGSLHMEVKAGTSPLTDSVSANFPEAAGLVGEIVDASGKGTAAITQFYYELSPSFGTVDAGLIFSPAYLDKNDIADDEYGQFMGAAFVNNPTIPLPVYALGVAATGAVSSTIGYTLFASSTADLQGGTYAGLLESNGHGAFVAGEMNWKAAGLSGNVGLWQNSDAAFTNFTTGLRETDYGDYGNLNGTLGSEALQWNMRLGFANPRVSQAASFVAGTIAYRSTLPIGESPKPVTYGLGVSYTHASRYMPAPKADMQQMEVYARVEMTEKTSITADMQYLNHSQFDPASTSQWVEGLRISMAF